MPRITPSRDQPSTAPEPQRVYLSTYTRFSKGRKRLVTAFLAYCGLLATMSTTSVLSAIPEVVETFNTSASVISISNAVYLACMGVSACLWGPWADMFGRRSAYIWSTLLFLCFSISTAVSPSLISFFVFRGLTALQGTAFLILGSSCISDIYHPTERATSLGWFLSGTMIGPAFGPIIGGIIVTYSHWRVIFWLQSSLATVSFIFATFFFKETMQAPISTEASHGSVVQLIGDVARKFNPSMVFKLYAQKHMLFISLASSSLVWNMYSLLTPIRYVLNPRLKLASPLQSGLLYISPGAGYILGTLIGGRWADHTVKRWMVKRGTRLPEDRLRSSLVFLGILLPGSMLLYGWTLDARLGGIPLPVICMFFQGVAQLAAFPSLNTYILDAMQDKSGQASASHYLMRYLFAGLASGLCLPLINGIGVGWTSTISAVFLFVCAGLVVLTIKCGQGWRATVTS